jgi:hypothetical protein
LLQVFALPGKSKFAAAPVAERSTGLAVVRVGT